MKTVLLVGDKAEQDAPELREALGADYTLITESSCAGAMRLLTENRGITALFLDEPSRQEGAAQLLELVRSGMSSFRSLPVLLVCDRTDLRRDSLLLGDAVADLVVKPVLPAILRNRLEKAEERANSMSFRELTSILTLLPSNIYIKDDRGRYVFSSEDTRQSGLRPDTDAESIIGKTDVEIRADKENALKAQEADLEIIRTGKGADYTIEVPGGDGPEYLQIIKEPIMGADGRGRGIIILINNVTVQERLRKKLEKMSITDQLTGLYNRSYLDVYAHNLKQSETNYPVSLISADCDGLKYVNDTLGHLAGDEYLRHATALFRETLPERAAIFRLGGDEFLVLLPQTGEEEAESLALALEENAGKHSVRSMVLSVSIGFGTLRSSEENFATVFKNSDEMMYQRKRMKKREGMYPFRA